MLFKHGVQGIIHHSTHTAELEANTLKHMIQELKNRARYPPNAIYTMQFNTVLKPFKGLECRTGLPLEFYVHEYTIIMTVEHE
jgi:hypothetical protein